jgi:hypothetical protein
MLLRSDVVTHGRVRGVDLVFEPVVEGVLGGQEDPDEMPGR